MDRMTLNLKELGALGGCSPAAIASAIRRGEIGAVTIGTGNRRKHVRIPINEAARWLSCSPAELINLISHGEAPGAVGDGAPAP